VSPSTPHRAALAAATLVSATLVFAGPALAGEICPDSRLDCLEDKNGVGFETPATRDSVDCGSPGQPAFGRFDLVAGTELVHANVTNGSSIREVRVTARDRYVVLGALPNPVSFTARLRVVGEAFAGGDPGDFGELIAHLRREGNGIPPAAGDWGTANGLVLVDEELVLNLTENVGQSFELEWLLEAIAHHGGTGFANATLTFTDLPKGAHVASCHGYAPDIPVPARPASWGQVKSAYR
jgi:hypothetical protein